jgi:hypothetical protein
MDAMLAAIDINDILTVFSGAFTAYLIYKFIRDYTAAHWQDGNVEKHFRAEMPDMEVEMEGNMEEDMGVD